MTQPQTLAAPPSAIRSSSHGGRGGAGNTYRASSDVPTESPDLSTPSIKTPHYTTGRGGTGNIMSNDNPLNARAAQDVEAPAHHDREPKGTYHWGRGGQGNVMTLGSGEGKQRTESQGVLEKAKAILGLGKGEGKHGSAVE